MRKGMRKRLSGLLCLMLLFTVMMPQAALALAGEESGLASGETQAEAPQELELENGVKIEAKAIAAPTYKVDSCRSTGEYIGCAWIVCDKDKAKDLMGNLVLKVYRADTKDGEFSLIGTTTGTELEAVKSYFAWEGQIVFRDTDVEPAKSYYYKAVSEVKLADGSVVTKESPRAYQLSAKNKWDHKVKFTSKLLNKRGTYAKTVTWKLTSDEANYKVRLPRKGFRVYSVHSFFDPKENSEFTCKISKVQYSFDGKTYKTLKDSVILKPGKTIYIKVTLKNKLYIRKDGKGMLRMNVKYLRKAWGKTAQPRILILYMDNRFEFYDTFAGDTDFNSLDEVWEEIWEEEDVTEP